LKTKTLDLGDSRSNLAAMRGARGIKVAELAEAAGLTPASIKCFNSGANSMPLDRFERMLSAFGARLVLVYDAPEEVPE